jgi:nitrogen regulatory protein PII
MGDQITLKETKMELLIITAARAFEKEIKGTLKKAGVKSFSYTDVVGYTESKSQSMSDNWFASSAGEQQSVLFYAFVQKTNVDDVLMAINLINETEESLSKIHVAVMDIKRSN